MTNTYGTSLDRETVSHWRAVSSSNCACLMPARSFLLNALLGQRNCYMAYEIVITLDHYRLDFLT